MLPDVCVYVYVNVCAGSGCGRALRLHASERVEERLRVHLGDVCICMCERVSERVKESLCDGATAAASVEFLFSHTHTHTHRQILLQFLLYVSV